jgi:hypothetical protein
MIAYRMAIGPRTRELLHLGDLRLVVREDQVDRAAVDVVLRPEQRLGDRRVLDVPARTTLAQRALPVRLARLAALPEHEIAGTALERVLV